jgi:hypothetical protein
MPFSRRTLFEQRLKLIEKLSIPRKLSKGYRLWTQNDDNRSLVALFRFGLGDWKRIAEFVGEGNTESRTLNQSLSKE